MGSQNPQGQAFLEMLLSIALFLLIWIFVQNSFVKQKNEFKRWEMGDETQTRVQTNLAK